MLAAVLVGYAFAGSCALVRLFLGPNLADRVVALDVALLSLMGGIVAYAADTGEIKWLNLLVVIAIVGFTATIAASRFVEHEGPER